MAERAILFIDGNNWYHACRGCGVKDLFALDYAAVSRKLVSPRDWVGSRYYIGALKQEHKGYREQRKFLSRLQNTDTRISVHLGRIEERPKANDLSTELLAFLGRVKLEPECQAELLSLAQRHRWVSLLKEKAVDSCWR
ncbi:MAG TPA: hypothetical protein VLE27_13110 [Thermoanaerobaculia bacterium]|nr:hypothetical protein [Thermoanaerobaculia bacterium]